MWLRQGFFIFLCGSAINAYNILILYPAQSRGFQFPMFGLIEALLKKGHHVTLVGTYKVPGIQGNFTFVDLSYNYYDAQEGYARYAVEMEFQRYVTKWDLLKLMPHICELTEKFLASARFKRFREKVRSQKIIFDSVIIDEYYYMHLPMAAEILIGLKPVIAFSTLPAPWVIQEYLGSFSHLSFSPSFLNPYTDRMNVWQKIENWISDTYFKLRAKSILRHCTIEHFRPELGQKTTMAVEASWGRVQLLLLASNSLYNYPRLYGPNVIEVGPLQILEKPQNLSETVKKFLDGAEKGVIYISMGSFIMAKEFSSNIIENFLKVFAELSPGFRVLWKWESDDHIPGQPDYILPQKWVQQQSVLAHPKVKVFITSGGLQSFQEAIHYGVPMIGIPWIADQVGTVQKMVDAGVGTRLEFPKLILYECIKETVNGFLASENYEVYLKNIKKYSEKTKDLTARSADLAVFWVEYISRVGDASHFRPSTADATIVEYFCLDILTVIVSFGITAIYCGRTTIVRNFLLLIS